MAIIPQFRFKPQPLAVLSKKPAYTDEPSLHRRFSLKPLICGELLQKGWFAVFGLALVTQGRTSLLWSFHRKA
jgi:hypothetical protein